jgi:hypothetical protein
MALGFLEQAESDDRRTVRCSPSANTPKAVMQPSPGLAGAAGLPWVKQAIGPNPESGSAERQSQTWRTRHGLAQRFRHREWPRKVLEPWNVLHNPHRVDVSHVTRTQGSPTFVGQPWAALRNAFSVENDGLRLSLEGCADTDGRKIGHNVTIGRALRRGTGRTYRFSNGSFPSPRGLVAP